MIATALTRAVRLGDELISGGGRRTRDSDPALQANDRAGLDALRMVGDELETTATEITRAADSRATRFPGILRRLIKRCNREPEAKDKHRQWWELFPPKKWWSEKKFRRSSCSAEGTQTIVDGANRRVLNRVCALSGEAKVSHRAG